MKTKKQLIQETRNLKKQVHQLNEESVKMTTKWLEEKQEYENQLQQLKQEALKNEMKWQEEKREFEKQLLQLKQEAAKTEIEWQEKKRLHDRELQLNEGITKSTTELQEEQRADLAHQLKKKTLQTTMALQGEKLAEDTQVQQMKLVHSDLQLNVDKLQQQERNFEEKERLKLKVQIFCSQESHLDHNLMEDLATLLKKHLCQEDIELKLLRQSDISEITPTELLLVLCMSLHASKSEILKAMKGINATKMTAVIMIHLKEPHALPTIPSKHKVREEIRRNLGGIFDMAFLRDRDGLYECPMNKRNVGEIVSFIKSLEMIGGANSNN